MKTVILGANGMLGHDLMAAFAREGLEAVGMDLPEIDITRGQDLHSKIPECDWVINCAAFTRVDDAESEEEVANAVNGEGAGNVARICAARDADLLHISTDYVFGGALGRPYVEDDATSPMNVYGSSKLAGENAIRGATDKYLIVRTESLFGVHGRNFVNKITEQLVGGADGVRVVSDQTVAPTYTAHLADAILGLMKCDQHGIVHVCASGSCTWFEFAETIAEAVGYKGDIAPISSGELAMAARRPAYSVLDTTRYNEWTGLTMPTWREGLVWVCECVW
jgi:dTDP-4-dehydrorhamnose reductase